jgi:hypothetical protein
MADPVSLFFIGKAILAALAALGVAAVVVKLLTWSRVVSWFRQRSALKAADRNNIGVIVRQALKSGGYSVATGVFNPETEQVLDAQEFRAEELDADLQKMHAGEDVVVVKS